MENHLSLALPMAEMLIIKRDFDLLKKLAITIKPELQMQLLPYTSLFCYESIEYLKQKGYSIEIDQTSRYSMKDIRQKAKFFDLSINKLLQSVRNIDHVQNVYFINLMRYPELGRWNMHDNIGVFYDAQKSIVGNSHYAYYVFQDEKLISKSPEFMKSHELQGEEIRSFAYDLGKIIGSISNGLSSVSDFLVSDITSENVEIFHQDFNTNRCTTNGSSEYKVIRLFLLHVLSSIGFLLYNLKKTIIRENGLLLRLEYITYHYSIVRLEGLMNYCNANKDIVNDPNMLKMFNSIDYSNKMGIRISSFRNCMMHFGLFSKEGEPLISEKSFDLSVPLCGLIETQFGMSYEIYKSKVEAELIKISDAITNYLGFRF
ncbi:hypothetical protein [Acetobacterium sp.]|uniref:hypothetical protein n=1 Tax=Acetobacterium sp. TaxID=1872094 RepID=UPI0035935E0F